MPIVAMIEVHRSLRTFGFCKKIWNLDTIDRDAKKKFVLYLQVFCYSLSVLEICSTHLTLQCYICLYHMEEHNNKAIPVTFVKTLLGQNERWKNIDKTSTKLFLVPSWIYDIVNKIQKFLRTSRAQIITTNGINFLMARPFEPFKCSKSTETKGLTEL